MTYEVMHLIILNTVKNFILYWKGNAHFDLRVAGDGVASIIRDGDEIDRGYIIPGNIWRRMGQQLVRSGRTIPACFGCTPQDIHEHAKRFKAVEWAAFLLYYSIPLLQRRLPERFLDHWRKLVQIWSICIAKKVNQVQLAELRVLVKDFIIGTETLYYQGDRERVSNMNSNIHGLAHLPDAIEDMGPASGVWSFVIERYCGMLGEIVKRKSKSKLDESMANAMRLEELLFNGSFARGSLAKTLREVM